jgi:hypothetical protein
MARVTTLYGVAAPTFIDRVHLSPGHGGFRELTEIVIAPAGRATRCPSCRRRVGFGGSGGEDGFVLDPEFISQKLCRRTRLYRLM